MTEEQLRDVLARVVPEPPGSVADAAPVVRVARRHRRVRVAAVSGLAAVLVAGAVVGVLSVTGDERERGLVADEPAISDPYATAPCPPLDEDWVNMPAEDLDAVTAVRYCGRPFDGFGPAAAPEDALTTDVSDFAAAVRAIPPADPARCATISVVATDSRLLLQLADGSYIGLPAGMCQDAEVEGRVLDGNDLTTALVGQLRSQRDDHEYASPGGDTPIDCATSLNATPALPGHEQVVAAVICPARGTDVRTLDEAGVQALDSAWSAAARAGEGADPCLEPEQAQPWIVARTDRGDSVRLDVGNCGKLWFQGYPTDWYTLDVAIDDLARS